MRIYYDLLAQNVNFEGLGRFFASGSLEAIADGDNVFARYKGGDIKEIYENFTAIQKQDGSPAGATATDVVNYLNNEFSQVISGVGGVTETTASIQTKRPLKTVVGQSLEGIGNILLGKSDVGLSSVDDTSDLNKPISTATQTALNSKANTSHTHAIADVSNLQSSLDSKVDKTTTVNAKTLNANVVLNTADIADSANKRYVLDADITKLSTQSGTNTGDETTASIQSKRPLKTVNGNSIEGSGNIVISGDGSSKPALTLVKANATTITETVIARWAIPANSITALSSILAHVRLQAGGTATSIWRLRVGTTGTITDTLLSQCNTSVAQVANAQGGGEFVVEFPTPTTAIGSGFAIMQNAVLGTSTVAGVTATIVPASIVYVSVTMQLSAVNTAVTKACLASWND
jgi:hypothetical protein